ncbi:hypothetical protein DFH08DRAFT_974913 [Mycena albidolilacea]|uniref:Uncharacterized protein n=1 Tax=Mycena albidolilacea TaxID=1033008 RepID=A0AAD7EB58_9AGAR|nr:hypothetical protein DFH08DRAFT_974913 [Mycena albidolilacea]
MSPQRPRLLLAYSRLHASPPHLASPQRTHPRSPTPLPAPSAVMIGFPHIAPLPPLARTFPRAQSITHFEWLRTSALAASVSGAFLSPISLPRRLRNVFTCMGAIEAGSALTVAEAPALKATAVLCNFRGFRRRAPRMGTAWGCAHGCKAAASLPASGGTSCAFPTHFLRATECGPTPLRRERARTFVHTHSPNHSCCPEPRSCSALNLISAMPTAHPFCRAGHCAGSTSLPAPACAQFLRVVRTATESDAGRRRAGPTPHRSLMVPNSPLEQGSGAGGGGQEGGIPVAGGASLRGLGLTLWWAQAAPPVSP